MKNIDKLIDKLKPRSPALSVPVKIEQPEEVYTLTEIERLGEKPSFRMVAAVAHALMVLAPEKCKVNVDVQVFGPSRPPTRFMTFLYGNKSHSYYEVPFDPECVGENDECVDLLNKILDDLYPKAKKYRQESAVHEFERILKRYR